MRDGILEKGIPRGKIHVIPNSADLELFNVSQSAGIAFRKKYDWLQERPLIVYTGTLGEINGVDYLVRLAALVKEQDSEIRFLVIGQGKEETKIYQLAKELNVLNINFFMINSLPKKAMPQVLSAATLATSLFVDLKAMWDNSANNFFDALASGTPIAINYGGWQADLLNETGAGIVLSPTDINQSAMTLIKICHDKQWLEKASQSARKLAEDKFNRDQLAKQLESVLQLATK